MADKKKPTKVIEREYIINLRKEILKAPRYKKSKKAIRALKEFLKRHMKSDDIKLGPYLNEHIWQNGPKNPPTKVEIKVKKEDEKVFAELKSAPVEVPENKKEEKKKIIEKKETTEEKPKQVDLSLVQKQKQVAKEKKKEEKPKEEK